MAQHLDSSGTDHQVRFNDPDDGEARPWSASGFGNRQTASRDSASPSRSRSPIARNDDATASPGTSAKARLRISKACTPCRKVKLKCNGGHPCGRCATLSLPLVECTYPPSLRGKTRRKKIEIEAERRAKESSGPTDSARPSSVQRGSSASNGRSHSFNNTDSATRQGDRPTQWDEGWTMRNMKEDFAKWKHDEYLTTSGPRNENIWHNKPDRQSQAQIPPQAPLTLAHLSSSHHIPDKYTSFPYPEDGHNPLGVLAEASATAGIAGPSKATSPSPFLPTGGPGSRPASEDGEAGEENPRGYYVPLERVLKRDAPHIMSLISISEAEQLFETYFKLLHPHLPFLDREHSTPSALAQRNNFLFNAICCVAARATNIMLWNRLKEFARFEMDRFPKDKNIDVVQAHLIYSVWNITGPMTFEQDKSWLRIGVAIRTGIDINLHRVALSKSARQGLPNWLLRMIIRTWLLTFIIDRTLSAQLGKPTTMRGEHSFQLYSELLSQSDGRRSIDDVWVSSLAEWTQVLGKVHDVFGSDSSDYPTARSVSSQFPDLVHVFLKQFQRIYETSVADTENLALADTNGRGASFVLANVSLYNRYARLIVHSFGLQRASDSRKTDLPSAFAEYQTSAIRLIEGFEADFEAVGFARGCPDFIFTFLTFAAVSLLKGAQPQYAHLEPNRPALLNLARKASGILSRSAATPDHLPAIQHAFLTRLIDTRSAPTQRPTMAGTTTMMDFEAFGQSIDADLSKTPWPPTGPSAIAHSISRPPTPMPERFSVSQNTQVPAVNPSFEGLSGQALAGIDTGVQEPDLSWGFGMGLVDGSNGMNDGFGWLSGVGASTGFEGEGDMLFAQDPFWKSLLEYSTAP